MKRFAFFIFVILLLALIWAGAWFFAANLIKKQVSILSNSNNQMIISCADFKILGFPFKMSATCKGVNIIDGDSQFSINQISAKMLVFSPTKIEINAVSPLKYSNAFFASEQELRFNEFKAIAATNWLKFKQIKINASEILYLDMLMGEEKIGAIKNLEFDLSNEPNEKNIFDLNIKIDGLDVILANIIDGRGNLNAKISAMPDDIRFFASPDFLQNWAKENGQIILNEFKGQDENSNFNIIGQIGLNEDGFASGNFTIKSKGIIEQISQNIDPQMQPLFFGTKKEDGYFEQDIKIKNGTIYRGLLPLGSLPALF